ncbi:MAG: DUF2953 domain-containing protein [Clostridium sp.]|nr:DUF2953 domain-containing protein [Clostridium sp.]MCM1208367.1 DUF2953 domain-containing protein [Ruminococcus sp.]
MHILLLILQIILWIFLGLLALVLLLLMLVLLAPVHYSADAVMYDDNMTVAARVRFLIVSVKVKFDKGTKKLDTAIKVLGIRLGGKNTEKVRTKKSKPKKIKKQDEPLQEDITEAEDIKETADIKEAGDGKEAGHIKEIEGIRETANINAEKTQENTVTDGIVDMAKTVQEGMEKKIKPSNKLNSGKTKLDAVNGKIETVKTKYARVKKFWKMNCTVKTRNYLKKYFPQLIKHIGPRKIKGHVRYGFDEPATTGQITGYLSLLPFMYHKDFFPEPDFYNKVLEGELSIRGRLQLGYIIRPAFKLHLWKTIKMARKI